ncbi:MAG: hypothetical protein E7632_02890 [Ruminococcaceae bacterium]|nr:hypothetical protein [Oscillospiraceae bacterium]
MDINLREYLRSVLTLEKHRYTYTVTMHNIINNIQTIENKSSTLQPEYPRRVYPPHMPEQPPKAKYTPKQVMTAGIVIAIIFIVAVMVLASALGGDLSTIAMAVVATCQVWGAIIVVAAVIASQNKKKELAYQEYLAQVDTLNKQYAEAQNRYNQECRDAEYECEEYKRTLLKFANELRKQWDELLKERNDLDAVIEKAYAPGIVFKKYRSLVPVAMFCEYLESGRCNGLEGHEGAYNIYESELRANLILDKLDSIAEKLDQIQSNQFMLFEAISESNSIASQLCREISSCSQAVVQSSGNIQAVQREQNQLLAFNNRVAQDIRDIQFYDTFLK